MGLEEEEDEATTNRITPTLTSSNSNKTNTTPRTPTPLSIEPIMARIRHNIFDLVDREDMVRLLIPINSNSSSRVAINTISMP
mmetsp:Transcript_107015/g.309531  ORF Transcript_107015/g.309531 Transcript_107015/m.309531 type:complete len:83 (+) Transcript_107015:104-352(+)